jgi:ADP-L-glycero-D-manno-heptose 6-epimerase
MSRPSYIVTGGAGFIGANIVAALNRRGEENILIVDNPDDPVRISYLDYLRYRDLVDPAAFRRRIKERPTAMTARTVFHMGACSSTTELDHAFLADNNTGYTRALCEWCLRRGARFVYASSAATYGDGRGGYADDENRLAELEPLNPYGWSKHRFDLWARTNGVLDRIAGLKYFNVYGPREDHKGDMRSVIHKACGQIRDTGEVRLFRSHRPPWRDGEQARDFLHVDDAVAVTLFFGDRPGIGGLFNCGTGQARTFADLAAAVFAAMGREPRIVFTDMPAALRARYQYHTQAEIAKLRGVGYRQPFLSLEEGVRSYVQDWLIPRLSV